ncbi:DUF1501 domain-containing protein [Oleiharenicola lentus]|uniref:DUF1501 domain-containing protein n=1 Tax=Oleiharenicola lentus TaxID=2508720 RepID=A0A4Q1C540_9BACT|nr:DUF1501 domain-containing protein [Oleiharenicola lentus]RXK53423.1 DUF1501 domain-containing protein [Oleiharenicola lentus]
MSSSSRPLTRREFIGQASCAGVGSTALMSTLITLRLANSLAAQSTGTGGDYRALVCLFLAGGNDSFNMLVPTTSGEYEAYAKVRGNLAIAKETLLSITPGNLGGRTLGIHPSMTEVRDLFTTGRLAFVSNVGSLVRPTTLADVKAGRNLPLSLYSHADQIKQWQTCIPDQRTAIGWGGRAADIIRSLNGPSLVSMNISLSGQNVFLTGQQAFTYSVGSSGATALSGYSPTATNNLTATRSKGVQNLVDQSYRNLLEQTYADSTRDAIDSYYDFSAAVGTSTLTTPIPTGNSLANNLAMIARIIAANGRLGARRQIFFVQLGGWDHHDEVVENQLTMLRTVSQAVGFFNAALNETGYADRVTLFTASDFGRTLTSNGNGSDHAWGGNHLVMGGAVGGGKVYGDAAAGHYPDLQNLAAIDTGQGRLIPGVSVDEYARDLLTWFGVTAGDMDYVLPAFSSRFGGRPSLGLFSSPATAPTTPSTPTPPTTPSTPSTPSAPSTPSSGGGGGGGAASPLFLGALGALALARLRQKRQERLNAEQAAKPQT